MYHVSSTSRSEAFCWWIGEAQWPSAFSTGRSKLDDFGKTSVLHWNRKNETCVVYFCWKNDFFLFAKKHSRTGCLCKMFAWNGGFGHLSTWEYPCDALDESSLGHIRCARLALWKAGPGWARQQALQCCVCTSKATENHWTYLYYIPSPTKNWLENRFYLSRCLMIFHCCSILQLGFL